MDLKKQIYIVYLLIKLTKRLTLTKGLTASPHEIDGNQTAMGLHVCTKKKLIVIINIYIYVLSRILKTSFTSACFGLENRECL
jgi:hypothetical protein